MSVELNPMNESAPLLACVVLSYRNQPTLVEAVRSLVVQDTPTELVVVNSGGGSPEQTLQNAGINVKVITCEHRLYAGAARNVGIKATSAPYVAFLAADCAARPGWARARIAVHLAGARAVSSAVVNYEDQNLVAWASYLSLFSRRMPGTPPDRWLHYGVSYARTLFDEYGLFLENLRVGEDTEFNQRFQSAFPIVPVPQVQSAHHHPTTIKSLLGDHFARGKRAAVAYRQIHASPSGVPVAQNAVPNAFKSLVLGWHATQNEPRNRRFVIGAAALMLPAALSYAAGALSAGKEDVPLSPPVPVFHTPSAGERTRLLAILVFRNEMRFLPDYFQNVAPHVDGIIALDDGSTDGSGEFVRSQPSVLELIQLPNREPHVWDEPHNRRVIIETAYKYKPGWILVVDADERLERDFRGRAEAAIEHAEQNGLMAYQVCIRELWDYADTYRMDGIWNDKHRFRLFKARRDHEFDMRKFHGFWAPLNSTEPGQYTVADLNIYHLRTMRYEDRKQRQQRYQQLDPNSEWQSIGYAYMTDEVGLRVMQIPPERAYTPHPDDRSANVG